MQTVVTDDDDEAAMSKFEMDLAFLGREVEKNSEFMFELQKQIDTLRDSLREIKAQLDQDGEPVTDRKPPHY